MLELGVRTAQTNIYYRSPVRDATSVRLAIKNGLLSLENIFTMKFYKRCGTASGFLAYPRDFAHILCITASYYPSLAYVHGDVTKSNTLSLIFVDRHTNRTCALYDFSKEHAFIPDKAYYVSGKVNAADKLYLVMESMKEDGQDMLYFF